MEKKNLFIGLLAIVFAIGSAFASLPPDLEHDSIRIASYDCRNVPQLPCEDFGSTNCRIDVIEDDVIIGFSIPVYEEVGCLQVRKSRFSLGYIIFD